MIHFEQNGDPLQVNLDKYLRMFWLYVATYYYILGYVGSGQV